MFNDDGLGQAMALSAAERPGKEALQCVQSLEKRVAELERRLEFVTQFLEAQVELNNLNRKRFGEIP